MDECMGVQAFRCNYVDVRVRESKKVKQKNYQNIHVLHIVSDMDPSEWANMSTFDAFELTHAAPHSVCWKELASSNIDSCGNIDMSQTIGI